LLILVKTGNQFGDGRLPFTRMTNEGQSLSGVNEQAEVSQNRFFIRIAEVQIVEMNLPLESRHILFSRLAHIRVSIDQGEDTLGCRETRLNLCPERRKVEHGEVELIHAHQEEIPRANRG